MQAYNHQYLQALIASYVHYASNTPTGYGWFYPPVVFFLILPFGLLPYWLSYLTFMVISLTGYVAIVRQTIKGSEAMWALAAFPGIWITLHHGQATFLIALCFGLAIMAIKKRSATSGVFFALLTMKPHFSILGPVALVAARHWSALLLFAMTGLLLSSIAMLFFGMDSFTGWLSTTHFAKTILEDKYSSSYIPSLFSILNHFGVPINFVYPAQGLLSLTCVWAVWTVWRKTLSWELRGAALVAAALLCFPYVWTYDLALLGLPIAWMTRYGLQKGWKPWEREILFVSWWLPALAELCAIRGLPFVFTPVVIACLLVVILRRAREENLTRPPEKSFTPPPRHLPPAQS